MDYKDICWAELHPNRSRNNTSEGKAITGLERPRGFQEAEAPIFQDIDT